ncbi:hypothetical protein MMC27_002881 [Xylographa pallens]|nr:hypothetical protein [Xylographa pallens]
MDNITWNENHTDDAEFTYATEPNGSERPWRFDGGPQTARGQEANTVISADDAMNPQVHWIYNAWEDVEPPARVLFPTSMNEEDQLASQLENLYQLNLLDNSSRSELEAPLFPPVYENAVLESRAGMDHINPLMGQTFPFVEERRGWGTAELCFDMSQDLYMPPKRKTLGEPFLNSVSMECAMMPNESGMYTNTNRSMNSFLDSTEALAPVTPSLGEERVKSTKPDLRNGSITLPLNTPAARGNWNDSTYALDCAGESLLDHIDDTVPTVNRTSDVNGVPR